MDDLYIGGLLSLGLFMIASSHQCRRITRIVALRLKAVEIQIAL